MQVFTKFPITLLLLTTLVICARAAEIEARPTLPRRGSPENVIRFEPLESVTTTAESTTLRGQNGTQAVSFHALGRQFDLQLEPNDLFAPGARTIWVGDGGARTEVPTTVFYKGEIKGEPGSWVRLSLRNGIMDGMIRSKNEIYFVEPSTRFFAGPSPHDMVIYRQSDTVSNWMPGSCALEQPDVAGAMEKHAAVVAPSSDYDALRAELAALAGGTLEQVTVGLVADYEYASQHGTGAATDMQNIINQVDGIYKSELGVTLRISTTVVFTTAGDPFSGTTDPAALLNEFSNYKSSAASPVHNAGLAHLFTGRDLDGFTIGIAWLGTVCDSRYGAGLSQDFTSDNQSLAILAAHEMGHNVNAPHDNQSGSPCGSTPAGFIMNPEINPTFDRFSSCSKSQIAPLVSAASCFVTVPVDSSCSYAISPSSATYPADGGTGTVTVTSPSACSWTGVSDAGWLTIIAGTAGAGDGTITYTASANPSTSARTGTLTIAGQTFTVTQAGVPLCDYALALTSATHGLLADTGTVTVIATSGCDWTAVSNASWMTITSGASGTGSGTVIYAVEENTGTGPRTGTLTIAGQTFTVTQAGVPPVCSAILAPTSRLHRALISKSQVRVTASSTCSWTAISNESWITILANPSGSGTKLVRYQVAPNPMTTPRSGTITIGGQIFTVNQKGLLP